MSRWPPSTSNVAPVTAVLVMTWTAIAARSAGAITRRTGSVARSSSRLSSSAASSPLKYDAASAVSTKPASIRLTRTGESSSASAAVNGRSSEKTAGAMPVRAIELPGAAACQQECPSGAHPRSGVARDLEHLHHALADRSAHVFGGVLEHRSVELARVGGDQDVVDRPRQIVEEPLHRSRVVGVERGAPACSDVARRLGEPFGVAPSEEDVGALAAGAAGGLEADSRAAAKHDDGLAEQRRLA